MMKYRLGLICVIVSLLAGAFIYFITRSEFVYLNQWISQINEGKVLSFFQNIAANDQLPFWVIYSLPDALWMFALIMAILTIWDFKLHNKSIAWLVMALAAAIMFELLQGFSYIKGTFDPVDLIMIMLSAVIPVSFILFRLRIWRPTSVLRANQYNQTNKL